MFGRGAGPPAGRRTLWRRTVRFSPNAAPRPFDGHRLRRYFPFNESASFQVSRVRRGRFLRPSAATVLHAEALQGLQQPSAQARPTPRQPRPGLALVAWPQGRRIPFVGELRFRAVLQAARSVQRRGPRGRPRRRPARLPTAHGRRPSGSLTDACPRRLRVLRATGWGKNAETRWRERSRTFLGVAEAMADQWGGLDAGRLSSAPADRLGLGRAPRLADPAAGADRRRRHPPTDLAQLRRAIPGRPRRPRG